MTQTNKVLGEANKFSYKWYEVQSSYNIDLYGLYIRTDIWWIELWSC